MNEVDDVLIADGHHLGLSRAAEDAGAERCESQISATNPGGPYATARNILGDLEAIRHQGGSVGGIILKGRILAVIVTLTLENFLGSLLVNRDRSRKRVRE